MNEIKTMKKNSKKGFTLVELVVVIAILAILAAIAIPVVSSTIESSQRSSALSNAQTVELALKEAHAQIVAGDTSLYTGGANTTVTDVVSKKAIKNVKESIKLGSKTYNLGWCAADDKCYYVAKTLSATGVTCAATDNIDGTTAPGGTVVLLDLDAAAASSAKVTSLF